MTRAELIRDIRTHEQNCSGNDVPFRVVELREFGDGIIAVLDTDGEYIGFFDKSEYEMASDAIAEISGDIRSFPAETTGVIEDTEAGSWEDIAYTLKVGLKKKGRGRIRWHRKPIPLPY